MYDSCTGKGFFMSEPKTIKAVYEHGTLRLLEPVDLPEQSSVTIIIVDNGMATDEIRQLAAAGGSFDFLEAPEEDVYSREDGEPI